MKNEERMIVAAPCGLYCGACTIYITYKSGDKEALKSMAERINQERDTKLDPETDFPCEGCLSSTVAWYCRECGMRDCAVSKGITHCAQCPDFPCKIITDFNDDEWPHHGEVLVNVERQKEIGITAWLGEQEKRWLCPECKKATGWYDTSCRQCGTKLPERFS